MGKRRGRRTNAAPAGPGLEVALGLDPAEWSVSVGYSKGFLSASRYTTVSVTHRPTGRTRKASLYAAGKAAARRDAASVAKRLAAELRGGLCYRERLPATPRQQTGRPLRLFVTSSPARLPGC